MPEWLQSIESLDQRLFLYLNGIHNETFDTIMYWISDRYIWIPMYLLIFIWLYRKFSSYKIFWIGFAAIALTFAITDLGSVHLFKKVIMRFRPCHNLDFGHLVHLVKNHCGGQYGFISSHASSTMGFALITSYFLQHRGFSIFIFTWVIVVSYSRIYLGVHYPGDIIGGWIWGFVSASIAVLLFRVVSNSLISSR